MAKSPKRRATGGQRLRDRLDAALAPMTAGRGYSFPVIQQAVDVKSPQAQFVLAQEFKPAAHSLFVLDVTLRFTLPPKEMEAVIGVVEKDIATVEKDLEFELARLKIVWADNRAGLVDLPTYKGAHQGVLEISTPQAARFVAMVRMLDEIAQYYDGLWFSGDINTAVRMAGERQWQQRLAKLGHRIVQQRMRAWKDAGRKGKQAEIQAIVGPLGADGLDVSGDSVPNSDGPGGEPDNSADVGISQPVAASDEESVAEGDSAAPSKRRGKGSTNDAAAE